MTRKTKDIIFNVVFVTSTILILGLVFSIILLDIENLWVCAGLLVFEYLLLGFNMYLLPRILDKRVKNEHQVGTINERVVINGNNHAWKLFALAIILILFFMGTLYILLITEHPNIDPIKILKKEAIAAVFMTIVIAPVWGEMIHRAVKNTYIIEGSNLIINEWAWFMKKTDNLTIPISEIDSVRIAQRGVWGASLVEIQVGDIKRKFTTGMVGDELYDELKRRMA